MKMAKAIKINARMNSKRKFTSREELISILKHMAINTCYVSINEVAKTISIPRRLS